MWLVCIAMFLILILTFVCSLFSFYFNRFNHAPVKHLTSELSLKHLDKQYFNSKLLTKFKQLSSAI